MVLTKISGALRCTGYVFVDYLGNFLEGQHQFPGNGPQVRSWKNINSPTPDPEIQLFVPEAEDPDWV